MKQETPNEWGPTRLSEDISLSLERWPQLQLLQCTEHAHAVSSYRWACVCWCVCRN